MQVRLPEQPCCNSDLAVLRPRHEDHIAGELRCAECGKHLRWMPKGAFTLLQKFTDELTRLIGPSDTPVLRSSSIKIGNEEMTFEKGKFEKKDNSGVLFKNQKKTTEQHPDYTGSITFEGKECWLSAWIKTSKAGPKYMSLSVMPKESDF